MRKFKVGSGQKLANIVTTLSENGIRVLTGAVQKDLKVKFDLENYEYETQRGSWKLAGPNTLENGLDFVGLVAGGDWEHPVFTIFYLDHKNKLRAYIPASGNPFNSSTKEAYGNSEESDLKNAKKRFGANVEPEDDEDCYDGLLDNLSFDWTLIRQDILGHFEKAD